MKAQKPDQCLIWDPFTKAVCEEVSGRIKKLFHTTVSPYDLPPHFTSPPKGEAGHWALPCFFLSRVLKTSPQQIAQKMAGSHSSVVFSKVLNKGPYVNFFFKKEFLKTKLLDTLYTGEAFQVPAKPSGVYLVEYSQPNTHKEIHIGHTRNLCFGQALVSLLKKRGFAVHSCTYPGDVGTHVAKCLWYLKLHNKEKWPEKNKGQWLGRIYAKACEQFEKDFPTPADGGGGKPLPQKPSPSPEVNKQTKPHPLTEVLKQLQNQKGEYYELWKITRQWSRHLMEEVYQWMGVRFDRWYWESEVDEPSVQWMRRLYKEGKLELSKGAVGLNLGERLGFLMLLKSDGNGLYATKDLYLMRKKFQDFQPEKNIYIVDFRQEGHFKQVFEGLSRIGWKREAQKSLHLKYNFVELKTGAMSSRAGNIVPLMTLTRAMTKHIITTFLSRYRKPAEGTTVWPADQIHSVAHQIAQGAIKYGMNEQDLNKKIVFDMKEWLKLDGKSGPYIQYAYARAGSLLKKLNAFKTDPSHRACVLKCTQKEGGSSGGLKSSRSGAGNTEGNLAKEWKSAVNVECLNEEEEWDLVVYMSWFSPLMEKCAQQMKTAPVCYYLYELAQKFSRFYQNCPIGTLKNEDQKNFRLFLVQVVRRVLKEGMDTLTIPTPDQM